MQILGPHTTESRPLRVNSAAKRLDCSERSVRRFIQNGSLPARRYGLRAWAIDASDVGRLLAQRRATW